MCLTSYWPIIFSIRASLLILTTSLGEIKGKMFKLPMNICKQIYKLRKNISIYNMKMNVIKWLHTEKPTWMVDSLIPRLKIMHPEWRTAIKALFLYMNWCLSVMWDSLSCSFTSISFLTTSCSFIWIGF